MHVSKEQLPVEKLGDYEGRMQQFADYYVNFENKPAGMGGPDLFKGRFKFTFTDGSQDVVSAGEA